MLRKTLVAFLFFCLMDVLLVSCCKDQFVTITGIFVELVDTADEDTAVINAEDFILSVRVNNQVDYSYLGKELSRLQNTAYATTCDPNYSVKNKATSFTITANTSFYGLEAGMPLNSLFNVSTDYQQELEIENMLDYLNFEEGFSYGDYFFTLKDPLLEETTLSFTIRVELENEEVIETESTQVTLTLN